MTTEKTSLNLLKKSKEFTLSMLKEAGEKRYQTCIDYILKNIVLDKENVEYIFSRPEEETLLVLKKIPWEIMGKTFLPLEEACMKGYTDCVKYLLDIHLQGYHCYSYYRQYLFNFISEFGLIPKNFNLVFMNKLHVTDWMINYATWKLQILGPEDIISLQKVASGMPPDTNYLYKIIGKNSDLLRRIALNINSFNDDFFYNLLEKMEKLDDECLQTLSIMTIQEKTVQSWKERIEAISKYSKKVLIGIMYDYSGIVDTIDLEKLKYLFENGWTTSNSFFKRAKYVRSDICEFLYNNSDNIPFKLKLLKRMEERMGLIEDSLKK